jgi:hypothetical protein
MGGKRNMMLCRPGRKNIRHIICSAVLVFFYMFLPKREKYLTIFINNFGKVTLRNKGNLAREEFISGVQKRTNSSPKEQEGSKE